MGGSTGLKSCPPGIVWGLRGQGWDQERLRAGSRKTVTAVPSPRLHTHPAPLPRKWPTPNMPM